MANAFLLRPLTPVAVTANSTAPGFAPENVANNYAGVVWKRAPGGISVLVFDFGAQVSIDTVMLFGLGGAQPGQLFNLVASATESQSNAMPYVVQNIPLLAGAVTPVSGRGVGLWAGSPIVKRYWGIELTSEAYQSIDVSVARVVMGTRFQPERNFGFGAGFGVKDLGSFDFSRRGVPLVTRGAKLRTASLGFSHVRKDEAEGALLRLFEQVGTTDPIALVTDPAEHPQRQNRCYFGPLVGDDLQLKWRNAAGWEAATNLVHII